MTLGIDKIGDSFAISNVECDRTILLSCLLCSSAVAEGDGGGCEVEVFDGTVLG